MTTRQENYSGNHHFREGLTRPNWDPNRAAWFSQSEAQPIRDTREGKVNDEDYPLDEERAAAAEEKHSTESSTREYWRERMTAMAMSAKDAFSADIARIVEDYLDYWMQTPELSLAELADSKPEYKLAVVDIGYGQEKIGYWRVVKMEGK